MSILNASRSAVQMDRNHSDMIQAIPFDDHHVHAPNRESGALTVEEFRRPFTESPIEETWTRHLSSQIGYRWMLRELAGLLGIDPDEAEIVKRRASYSALDYHRLLAEHANLGECYADDLFAAGKSYDVEVWSRFLGGRKVHRVLRIETFVEQGYETCPTLDDALHRLVQEIEASPERGVVSLKSIAGYRSGLEFEAPSSRQRVVARRIYRRLRDAALDGGSGRIADKALVDTLVWTALEAAIPLKLPMQFHVAIGDNDIVLGQNDPSLMRALFEHEPFRDVPLVLLHCYPYHRHAGYLASIYPNVYVDLGLTIPIVGPGAVRIIEEALELTPVSQLLASTDGHMTPEFQWFGVYVWRWAIQRVIGNYVGAGALAANEAEWLATAVLNGNARRIYPRPS